MSEDRAPPWCVAAVPETRKARRRSQLPESAPCSRAVSVIAATAAPRRRHFLALPQEGFCLDAQELRLHTTLQARSPPRAMLLVPVLSTVAILRCVGCRAGSRSTTADSHSPFRRANATSRQRPELQKGSECRVEWSSSIATQRLAPARRPPHRDAQTAVSAYKATRMTGRLCALDSRGRREWPDRETPGSRECALIRRARTLCSNSKARSLKGAMRLAGCVSARSACGAP